MWKNPRDKCLLSLLPLQMLMNMAKKIKLCVHLKCVLAYHFRMVLVPTANEVLDKRYMAYAIRDKVGLVILPLDGNPHNSSAIIAHPRGVSHLLRNSVLSNLFDPAGHTRVDFFKPRAAIVSSKAKRLKFIEHYKLHEYIAGRSSPTLMKHAPWHQIVHPHDQGPPQMFGRLLTILKEIIIVKI